MVLSEAETPGYKEPVRVDLHGAVGPPGNRHGGPVLIDCISLRVQRENECGVHGESAVAESSSTSGDEQLVFRYLDGRGLMPSSSVVSGKVWADGPSFGGNVVAP